MSNPPLLNAAGEPIDPNIHYVRIARRGMLGGLSAGALAVAVVLWLVRTILAGAPAADQPVTTGLAPNLLIFGIIGSSALGAGLTWWRLGAIESTFRRGGLSLVAAIGTIVFAIAATPLYHTFGRSGLLGLAAVGAVGAACFLPPRSDEIER